LLEAAIRSAIGQIYSGLGVHTKSRSHLSAVLEIYQRERGPTAPETANAMVGLGESLVRMGESSKAEPILRQGLVTLRRTLGAGHPKTLLAMVVLGVTCRELGMLADSETLLSEATEAGQRVLGPEDTLTLCALADLAYVYAIQGKLSQAEPPAVQAEEVSRRVLKEGHPVTMWASEVLMQVYESEGRLREAERVARTLLESRRKSLGEDHQATIGAMSRLARLELQLGRLQEADQTWRKIVTLYEGLLDKNPNDPKLLNNMAWVLVTNPVPRFWNPNRAVELARSAVEKAPRQSTWNTLGVALYRHGDLPAAIDALGKSMELGRGGDGSDWFFLAMAHWQLGDKPQARSWYDKAVGWMEENQPTAEELIRFRAEAAALLGLPEPTAPARREVPHPSKR
jgi:tetratricopeptide (TPR) repeat protein